MASLGHTGLDVFPICLGGNVFGWGADEPESRGVLDAYVAAGGNFIDTANSYLVEHGRSETILGRWFSDRGNRDQVVLATKVGGGHDPRYRNLKPETIRSEAHASLGRLQTDYIDLYYAHFDDAETPLEESLRAFDGLVREGLVRHIAASNYTAERLAEALSLQRDLGLAQFVALQPHYNLVERSYEQALAPVVAAWDLAALPYYALASGFLTGKYRPGGQPVASVRARRAGQYLSESGEAALKALDQVAAEHQTSVAAVAIAWLLTRPTVTAPIASARTTGQLAQILPAAELELTSDEVDLLTSATAQA
jgi:aryl-alcohol dehydrogenase-like predicted oxidoreductase